MTTQKKIDPTRRMGTSAFKKEINHLLHTRNPAESKDGFIANWNSRDHALVMALLLKRNGVYPKIVNGKCMFVQGPHLKYSSIGVGQEVDYVSGHSWVVDPAFNLIDVSPILEIRKHRFRASFNGVFGRVWLPQSQDRTRVVVCDTADDYERAIDKSTHLTGQSSALYFRMDDIEVSERLIRKPFKFLGSNLSVEIKKRFGAGFYPAAARHLHRFMLGDADSLTEAGGLEARNTVFDRYAAS